MLLLIGPPGSGKTSYCVGQTRDCLRKGDPSSRLLVPTTTLAEHLRNQLAREGFVFSPKAVSTFGKYLSDSAKDVPVAGSAMLQILCGEILKELKLSVYGPVSDFPGFRAALVHAIEEFAGAGGELALLRQAGAESDFIQIVERLQQELRRRGLRLRGERLPAIAQRIRDGETRGPIWVTGFFNFTPPEIAVLKELARKSDLTVTLPDSRAARPAVDALREFSTEVRVLDGPGTTCRRVVITAPTQDAEAVDIARRVLEARAQGRLFREMGVVVRSEVPCVPALRAAFERFGIPARFYFSAALGSHPTILYLSAIVDAVLSGWDHEATVRALRMNGSPVEQAAWGDRFERRVLEHLPGQGLPSLVEMVPEGNSAWFLDELNKLTNWQAGLVTPSLWRERFLQLPALFHPAAADSRASHTRAMLWRSQSTALEHFGACVVEASEALAAEVPVSCADFWSAVRTVIGAASVHLVDRRRDVVHVIDVFEARQWRLPVVFLCGLLEGEFPKHFSEDPILPDAVRLRLKALGLALRTTAEKQEEESALFDTALTRASERLYLSYARLNAKGEPNLPSFHLERAKPYDAEPSAMVRPVPARSRAPEPQAVIYSEEMREALAARHGILSATAIEAYLHCPFNLFATRTLKLAEAPCSPWERLNMLVQGNIAHATFELCYRDGIPVHEAFEQAFARYCGEECIPNGYRTEAVRLELLSGIELLAARNPLPRWRRSFFELPFEVAAGELKLRGKIDRLEVDADGNAFVIDYKYQNRSKIRETVAAHEDGKKVQGGVYVLAAEALGYRPAGMVFCGFRQEVTVDGWVRAPFEPGLGIQSSADAVSTLPVNARQAAMQVLQGLRDGRIAPQPSDDKRCARCTFLKICRVDAAPARRAAGAETL